MTQHVWSHGGNRLSLGIIYSSVQVSPYLSLWYLKSPAYHL
jgi:hypothetical protein